VLVGPGRVTQVFADGKGWVREGGRTIDAPSAEQASMRHGLWRDANFILLHATEPGAKVRAAAPLPADGGLEALAIVSPEGEPTRVLLDPKTHQVVQLVYNEDGKEVRDQLGDYRPEGGIAFPHKMTHTGDGQVVDVTYDQIAPNAPLPPDAFRR
jgi:hypothetical protein